MMGDDRQGTISCREFRGMLDAFQADELEESRRETCQSHLDHCAACADRVELEAGMERLLRAKLGRTPAPPGLETRVRAALRGAHGPGSVRVPWFRTPWFAATAGAVLLMALLLPGLTDGTRISSSGKARHVTQQVTVVDHDCDKAGKDAASQRRCRHPLHVNALKLPDGDYWTISPRSVEFRYLLLDADSRGRRFEVEGDYYPGADTIVLQHVAALERDQL